MHIRADLVGGHQSLRRLLGHHAEGVLAVRGDSKRLATVFAESTVPMVLSDDERHYVDANQLAQDTLGLGWDALKNLRIDDVTPPYLLAELEANWLRLLETGMVIGDEVAEQRRYVAFPWYAVADVLPGNHVVAFVPQAAALTDLPHNGDDTAREQDTSLTPRELEVLELATNGLNAPGIAERLVLSTSTVRTHFGHIYEKLEVPDRAAAVAKAMRLGLIS